MPRKYTKKSTRKPRMQSGGILPLLPLLGAIPGLKGMMGGSRRPRRQRGGALRQSGGNFVTDMIGKVANNPFNIMNMYSKLPVNAAMPRLIHFG